MRTVIAALFAGLALALVGCGRKSPPTLADTQTTAEAALIAVRTARTEANVKVADRAARDAAKAEKTARSLCGEGVTLSEEQKAAFRATLNASRETAFQARVCHDEARLSKMLSSWRCKAARKSTGLAIEGTLLAFEKAAMAMADAKDESLPEPVRKAAEAGREFAEGFAFFLENEETGEEEPQATPEADASGPSATTEDPPAVDWEETVAILRRIRTERPATLHFYLAVAAGFTGRNSLALYEIEGIEPTDLEESSAELYPIARSFILYRNELGALALELVLHDPFVDELLGKESSDGRSIVETRPLLLLLQAVLEIKEKRYLEADKTLADACRLLPDDPFFELVKLESQAAQGNVEGAKQRADTKLNSGPEWLREAARERVLGVQRDPTSDERLFTDPGFLARLLLAYAAEHAARSETMRRLRECYEATKTFLGQLPEKLPGRRTEEEASKADVTRP